MLCKIGRISIQSSSFETKPKLIKITIPNFYFIIVHSTQLLILLQTYLPHEKVRTFWSKCLVYSVYSLQAKPLISNYEMMWKIFKFAETTIPSKHPNRTLATIIIQQHKRKDPSSKQIKIKCNDHLQEATTWQNSSDRGQELECNSCQNHTL